MPNNADPAQTAPLEARGTVGFGSPLFFLPICPKTWKITLAH